MARHRHLAGFWLDGGVPRWRWDVGDVQLEREVAMVHGSPTVAVLFRLLRAQGPVTLELTPLCTWRDVHGERHARGEPAVTGAHDGFVFEDAYRVSGPGWEPGGEWYFGLVAREEAARGLAAVEDLWAAGRFVVELEPGTTVGIVAAGGSFEGVLPRAEDVVRDARRRAADLTDRARATDAVDAQLVLAADSFVIHRRRRPVVPPRRRSLRDVTSDLDTVASLAGAMEEVLDRHLHGTRFGIGADPADGLLRQGQDGLALTWMDARVDGHPVTARQGKAVEINALWINGLTVVKELFTELGRQERWGSVAERATMSFRRRFPHPDGAGLLDVVDGPGGDDPSLRPNQLLAVSLPHAPVANPSVVEACRRSLLTSLGLRSLAPCESGYHGRHRGDPAERDRAYHQGTV